MTHGTDAILASVREVTGLDPMGGGVSMSRLYVRRVAVYALRAIAEMELPAIAAVMGVSVCAAKYDYSKALDDAGVLAAAGRVRRRLDKEVA